MYLENLQKQSCVGYLNYSIKPASELHNITFKITAKHHGKISFPNVIHHWGKWVASRLQSMAEVGSFWGEKRFISHFGKFQM